MLTVREKSCQNSAKCLKFDNPILPSLKSLAEILPTLKRLMALGKILPTLKRLRYILINSANSETFEPKILPSLKRLRLILPSESLKIEASGSSLLRHLALQYL